MVVEQQVDGEMNLWGEEVGRWCRSFHGSWRWCLYHVREDINEKKTFSFGHCPNHLNPPPLTPIRATWSFFFGRQKRRFSAYYRTK